MEGCLLLQLKGGSSGRREHESRRRYSIRLTESPRRAPSSKPSEQLAHRPGSRSIWSGQSQGAFSLSQLLLRRHSSLNFRPPPPQDRRSFLQHAVRHDTAVPQWFGPAVLPQARLQPVQRLSPAAEPVGAHSLQRLSQ